MRQFMDYVQTAFYETTGWSRDSSYSSLNATADALLSFPTPRGVRLTLSSLATPHFATSYQLGSVGIVDGSISYLFSSAPLSGNLTPESEKIFLPSLLRSYRALSRLPQLESSSILPRPPHPTLLYGRLYLPRSLLESLVVTRVSPALQLQLNAVSAQSLRNGGTALGLAQYDVGRYAVEGLASTDGGLLGVRGIYNFGGDLDTSGPASPVAGSDIAREDGDGQGAERERIYGRFSAGGELYYGTLNKSGGMSVGARFATLPEHKGTPLTATLTLNPLMGNISATYAVEAGKRCSLATRLDFNVYSYESHWAIGMELWRKAFPRRVDFSDAEMEQDSARTPMRSFQAKLEWRLDHPEPRQTAQEPHPASGKQLAVRPSPAESLPGPSELPLEGASGAAGATQLCAPLPDEHDDPQDEFGGVLKARVDEQLKIGLLWEGRVKSLLFSIGSGIDLRKVDGPFRTLGIEIQFSS